MNKIKKVRQMVQDFQRVRRDARSPVDCVVELGGGVHMFQMNKATREYMKACDRLPPILRKLAVKTSMEV